MDEITNRVGWNKISGSIYCRIPKMRWKDISSLCLCKGITVKKCTVMCWLLFFLMCVLFKLKILALVFTFNDLFT